MILERTYEYILKLPNFRGKARIDEALRHFLRPKASRIIHDIAMELDPEEWLQIDLRKFGRLEPRTTAAFERILKHGGICVDVGAHIGYHAMLACHLVGTNGQVFAIDPSPTIATGC
jgi:ubiquinone/menaquinone biosynthesis C-methylase UbiE